VRLRDAAVSRVSRLLPRPDGPARGARGRGRAEGLRVCQHAAAHDGAQRLRGRDAEAEREEEVQGHLPPLGAAERAESAGGDQCILGGGA